MNSLEIDFMGSRRQTTFYVCRVDRSLDLSVSLEKEGFLISSFWSLLFDQWNTMAHPDVDHKDLGGLAGHIALCSGVRNGGRLL